MKKIGYFLSVTFLLTAFGPMAMAKDAKKEKPELTVEEQARLSEIEERIVEIKAMDFSEMSKEERRAVRDELKGIKKEAKTMEGVYLSVGAIIIILLILILLL